MEYLGKNITQPYISKITIEPENSGDNIVAITVSMNNGKRNPKMVETMQTSIIKISNKKAIDRLKLNNNRNMILELIENSKNDGRSRDIEIKVLGPSVAKKTITQKFHVDENVSDLSFYVICQYNTNHPYHAKKIFNSPNYKKRLDGMAAVISEDVIKNGNTVKKANIFVLQDPSAIPAEEYEDYSILQGDTKVWTGPIHSHNTTNPSQSGYIGYMGGHVNKMGPKLNLVSMPNTTLHDYRIFDKISKINFNYRLL